MMAFVKDQQAIAVSQSLGVEGRTVVCRYQEGGVIMRAAAQEADSGIRESRQQVGVPLMHEV